MIDKIVAAAPTTRAGRPWKNSRKLSVPHQRITPQNILTNSITNADSTRKGPAFQARRASAHKGDNALKMPKPVSSETKKSRSKRIGALHPVTAGDAGW